MSRSFRRRTRVRWRPLAATATTSLLLLGAAEGGLAGDETSSLEPMVRLEQQLLGLQRQIAEMERRHAEEMKALKEEIRTLRDERAAPVAAPEDELAGLRRLAEAEAARAEEAKEEEKEVAFAAKGLSLQALNPEISVTGDMLATYRNQEGTQQHSDIRFRTLGLHLESYLDPYTRFKAAIPVSGGGAELGEAYMMPLRAPRGLQPHVRQVPSAVRSGEPLAQARPRPDGLPAGPEAGVSVRAD